ncbi:hypothetical protein N779_26515 [Vibrio coralliilyticus OCN008]|nr:hypothetical protein N779_26515 [Vibrio coralliilyticus OCN008]
MSIGIEYIFVIFLLVIILAFVPYISRTKMGKRIKDGNKIIVKEKVYLDNTTKLYVVDYEGRKLFVASNSSSISITVDNTYQDNKNEY